VRQNGAVACRADALKRSNIIQYWDMFAEPDSQVSDLGMSAHGGNGFHDSGKRSCRHFSLEWMRLCWHHVQPLSRFPRSTQPDNETP
jgi:hypothetical protein